MNSKSTNSSAPTSSNVDSGPVDPVSNTVQCEPLIDSIEAAQLLRIHPKTLQRMARNQEVPGIQIGRLWRFRMSELNAWIEEQTAS